MFADDSKCFRVILGQDDGNALQNDLDRLLDWTKTWGMEFNFSKCKVKRITRKNVPFEWDYYLSNYKLNRVIIEYLRKIWEFLYLIILTGMNI
jgi:hypothetical protein